MGIRVPLQNNHVFMERGAWAGWTWSPSPGLSPASNLFPLRPGIRTADLNGQGLWQLWFPRSRDQWAAGRGEWVFKGTQGGQEEVCSWCAGSEVAGDGLPYCIEMGDFVLMTLEKQYLCLFGAFRLIGRNIALPLQLAGEHEEDERSLWGNPGWCGTSVAGGEGATVGGDEVLVKAAHGWEVWLCSICRCGEEEDYSPRWL